MPREHNYNDSLRSARYGKDDGHDYIVRVQEKYWTGNRASEHFLEALTYTYGDAMQEAQRLRSILSLPTSDVTVECLDD